MINKFQTAALGCISAGARYDRFWREADIRRKFQDLKGYWQTGMLLEALSRDDDRIAHVGRIAREQAMPPASPATTSMRARFPRVDHRHDPDGTRHVLADGDEDVIVNGRPLQVRIWQQRVAKLTALAHTAFTTEPYRTWYRFLDEHVPPPDAAFERAAIIALVRSGFDDGFIRHLHPDWNGDRHDPRV